MAPALDVRPLTTALGAEVRGIALGPLSDSQMDELRALLLEHLVLFFPDQALSLDDHVAFGRQFGELEVHPNLPRPDDEHPEVVQLAASAGGIADEWHTDVTFRASPPVMSIMHMVTCPPLGGDTMWANQYLAYDELAPAMQEMLCGLTALHDATPHGRRDQQAVHPVVRIHPETGRRSLLVNEHFTQRIVEVSHDESEALLGFLTRWSVSERFTVRYRWTPGTVAIWDNRCTQHFVLNDFTGERVIQRVSVLGDIPEGDPPRWEPRLATGGSTSTRDAKVMRYMRSVKAAVALGAQ